MIRTGRCNRASVHSSRNSRLSNSSITKRQGQCFARFRHKAWVPLLLGAVLASCDPGGVGGVPSVSGGGGGTRSPKPKAWYVTTLAGGGSAGKDGIGAAAGFSFPFEIAQIGDTLYVTDRSDNSIRTVQTTTARVGTIVSGNTDGGHRDGAGTSARFNNPRGAAAGAGSTLYLADQGNHRIREIRAGVTAAATQVRTLAGSTEGYADNATGAAAQFSYPTGVAVSGDTLYVADTANNRIRAIDLAGANKTVSTIAGSGTAGHTDGAGAGAQFDNPAALAVSGDTLYVVDVLNHRIRAIDLASANKTVSTIAGSGTPGHADGASAAAQFDTPNHLAVSGSTLYVSDSGNHCIRAIDLESKTVSTIAGSGTAGHADGAGTQARFNRPLGIVVSGNTLYVASGSLIRKLEYREVNS